MVKHEPVGHHLKSIPIVNSGRPNTLRAIFKKVARFYD